MSSSSFVFFKLPQQILKEYELSNNERIVYTLLKDRQSLSTKNGRIDVIYTRDNLAKDSGLSVRTITTITNRLAELKLIVKKQQGLNKPNLYYVPELIENQGCAKVAAPKVQELQTNQTNISHTNCISSSSINADTTTTVVNKIKNANINISNAAIEELSTYIDSYGIEYISHLVDYAIDAGSKSYKYIQTVINSAINKGNITIELFDKSVNDYYQKQTKQQDVQEVREEPEIDYTNHYTDQELYLIAEGFKSYYEGVMGVEKEIYLSNAYLQQLLKLRETVGKERIYEALDKALESEKFLKKVMTIPFFFRHFDEILSDKYIDRELVIYDDQYYYMPCTQPMVEETPKQEKVPITEPETQTESVATVGGVKLDTITQTVGTETVEQVQFSVKQEMTERQLDLIRLYKDKPYDAYTSGKITYDELEFLWMNK